RSTGRRARRSARATASSSAGGVPRSRSYGSRGRASSARSGASCTGGSSGSAEHEPLFPDWLLNRRATRGYTLAVMLVELRIQNYAVIDRLAVRLAPGLNVLTGETGAGKSIIVGALSLLLGGRASADVVRTGEERAVIEGVFDVEGRAEVLELLDAQGLEAEDGPIILRREVAAEGRNRAWVNGSATTAAVLGEIGRRLVDLHGQHEHQTLLRSDEQRAILDAFAGAEALAAETRAAYDRLVGARRALEDLDRRRREVEQRADFLRFQAEEIERAQLKEGEEEALEEEANRLEHAEDLARLSGRLHQALYAAEDSATARLGELRRV